MLVHVVLHAETCAKGATSALHRTCLFGTAQRLVGGSCQGAFELSCGSSRFPKSGEVKCCSKNLYSHKAGATDQLSCDCISHYANLHLQSLIMRCSKFIASRSYTWVD
eukprot:gnl/TRDRNA2_/TRDRNA2_167148_c3_seq1.p1 gnl/TRDRNA2_/TRDRNA2_167148_c3~~gnl/TRDRNA2_/TRDRNA2_167148_c3_seq1.p1  ORF type:complete len:108 (-),score=9.98 gnl/TRDRNA2_/TRDRNA2_167148_c3_seq1:22-345(-)